MYKIKLFKILIAVVVSLQTCIFSQSCKSSSKTYKTLNTDSKDYNQIKKYFLLSENREIYTWYKSYLTKCNKFYNIENPTRDTIINLIKSYWLTSNNQHHNIKKIECQKQNGLKNCWVTMDYSYTLITTNTIKIIKNLKLQMNFDNKNNVISIYEISRE